MKYYKVLDKGGKACNGGQGQWLLPHDGLPGEWMPTIEDPQPCERGYHLCRPQDLVLWLGPAIYEAEGRGQMIEDKDKVVFSEARLLRRLETWNDRTAKLFACDCAERVLPLFEKAYPDDKRPGEAIRIARLYANGQATAEELDAARAAARDAASAAAQTAASATAWAAWDAAWAADWAAAWAAWAADWTADSAAARAAASAAARAAAWAADWDAA